MWYLIGCIVFIFILFVATAKINESKDSKILIVIGIVLGLIEIGLICTLTEVLINKI